MPVTDVFIEPLGLCENSRQGITFEGGKEGYASSGLGRAGCGRC